MSIVKGSSRTLDPSKFATPVDGELIRPHHDLSTTQDSIQKILAGGTPNWVSHPEEYRNFVRESFAAEKEISDEMSEKYQMEDQAALTNRKARMVNSMSTDNFIKKLRQNGIKCFTVYNGLQGTVALWCLPPRQLQKARYVCFLQVPAMWEWSVLKVDRHNVPQGEAFRGWRTVLAELIRTEILTEYQAHQIFGYPSHNPVFSRYHQTLWEIRNGKRYDKDLASKDV